MISKNKHPRLEVTAGNQVGKVYQLKKPEYSIGTHRKCQIRVSGEYASELHAVLKLNAEGIWTLANNSPNGTYVNQVQVDLVDLDQPSSIQVGVENSFDFTPSQHKAEGEDGGSSKKTSKWVWIGCAVAAVYLPLFLFLTQLGGSALVGLAEEQPIITLEAIERVSVESSTYLNNYPINAEGYNFGDFEGVSTSPLHEKFTLGAFRTTAEKDEMIKALIDQSKAHMTTAHHYVQMGLNTKAENSLRSAMAVFPDHRFPVAGFGAKIIAELRSVPEY